MAYGDTFHPAGTSRDVKVRGPVWVALWSLTPYSIFWFYFAVKDLSEYGKAKGYDLGQNPTNSLLAIFPGFLLLLIPTIIAIFRFFKRIQQAQRLAGTATQLNGWLVLVMYVVGVGFIANGYAQSELNKAWAAEGGPVPEKDELPQQIDSGPSGAATTASTATATDPALGTTAPEAPNPERPPGT